MLTKSHQNMPPLNTKNPNLENKDTYLKEKIYDIREDNLHANNHHRHHQTRNHDDDENVELPGCAQS